MRLLIIGAGPAGYSAAFEAAAQGMDVTLVENRHLGGICLNRGCIPTKSLRASADALVLARRMEEFGIRGCSNPAIDPQLLQKRKDSIISSMRDGLEKKAAKLGVKILYGKAALLAPGKALLKRTEGDITLACDRMIIATGSKELIPRGLELDHKYILTSADALNLPTIPKKLIIAGGGFIGCELACIFRDFGAAVTIVEEEERLLPLPSVDEDISALLAREMRKRKVRMRLGATVRKAVPGDEKVRVMLELRTGGDNAAQANEEELEADMVFVCLGRAPDTDGLGLKEAGIKCDARGWIEVDGQYRTSVQDIYAAGDVLGPSRPMLAHTAVAEGLAIVNHLLGKELQIAYNAMPCAIFTSPEIGFAGLSERQARERHPNVLSAIVQMRELGKAQAMGELPGLFKLIANADNGRILGIQIMGAHSSDILGEACLALAEAVSVDDLAHTIHAHPTLAEGLGEAARRLQKELLEQI